MRQWRAVEGSSHLCVGDCIRVCEVVAAKAAPYAVIHGWALPGVVAPASTFDSVSEAKQRAEQLLELWLHRAGLEES